MIKYNKSTYFKRSLKVNLCLLGISRNNEDNIINLLSSLDSHGYSTDIDLSIYIISWIYEVEKLKGLIPKKLKNRLTFISCGIEPPIIDVEYRDYRSSQNQFKQLVPALRTALEEDADFMVKIRLDDSEIRTLTTNNLDNIINFMASENKSFSPYANYTHPFWWDDRFFILNKRHIKAAIQNLGTRTLTLESWNYFPEYILWSTIASETVTTKALKVIDSIDWRMMCSLKHIYPNQSILYAGLSEYCNFLETDMSFTRDFEEFFACPSIITQKSNNFFPGKMKSSAIVKHYRELPIRLQSLCKPYGYKKISRFSEFNAFINKCIVSNQTQEIIDTELPKSFKGPLWQESSILVAAKAICKYRDGDYRNCLDLLKTTISNSPTSYKWLNIIYLHIFSCMSQLGIPKNSFPVDEFPLTLQKNVIEEYERLAD